MNVFVTIFIGASVLVAGFISGAFGMAGGMILMGALLLVLPVPTAMVLHGVTQMTSNGWRGVVWRRYVDFRVFLRFTCGLLAACALFFFVSYVPDRATVLICLGCVPFLVMLVPPTLIPQADRPFGAEICGFLNVLLQFMAGVSGPVLDAFFIRSEFDRRTIVATKAVCQTAAHFAKLIYFLQIGHTLSGEGVDTWIFGLCIFMAVAGTTLSRTILDRLSDTQFRRWTKSILMVVGGAYLAQGIYLYAR
ncbi:permease [Pollutimonas nitritireducens]|uniref:Probable membrane transporter protein n=1 Tax=Pollutimonas nitritireducens TaxID=2045209 RepID=A0A2N4UK07_9BURK|nr:sulfite exporter TauE/SafE family protein [Pollutimonas nitritireducens]PLC55305.1 permease [Pollutimonas nitritireducens]